MVFVHKTGTPSNLQTSVKYSHMPWCSIAKDQVLLESEWKPLSTLCGTPLVDNCTIINSLSDKCKHIRKTYFVVRFPSNFTGYYWQIIIIIINNFTTLSYLLRPFRYRVHAKAQTPLLHYHKSTKNRSNGVSNGLTKMSAPKDRRELTKMCARRVLHDDSSAWCAWQLTAARTCTVRISTDSLARSFVLCQNVKSTGFTVVADRYRWKAHRSIISSKQHHEELPVFLLRRRHRLRSFDVAAADCFSGFSEQ